MSRRRFVTDNEELNKILEQYGAYEEDGYLHLKTWCDSTLVFLLYMKGILEAIGCTDIKEDSYNDDTKTGLYTFVYHVWGKIPGIGKETSAEPGVILNKEGKEITVTCGNEPQEPKNRMWPWPQIPDEEILPLEPKV